MSEEVQFDTDNQTTRSQNGPVASFGQSVSTPAGMAGWLMRHGIAKTPAVAQSIMVGVILVDVFAVFVIIKFFL
jgi:hypothetical protein